MTSHAPRPSTASSTDAFAAKRRLADASTQLAVLEKELSTLEEVRIALKSEERRFLQRIAAIEAQCESLETKLAAGEDRRELLDAQLDEARSELDELEVVVAGLERGVGRKAVELRELEKACAEVARHVERAKHEVQSGVGSVLRMDQRMRTRD
jgi:chromosome segregation ATPase